MSIRQDILIRAFVAQATVKRRSSGTFFAFVPSIAHRAFADGKSPDEALARLHIEIESDLPAVIRAWDILGPDPDPAGTCPPPIDFPCAQ